MVASFKSSGLLATCSMALRHPGVPERVMAGCSHVHSPPCHVRVTCNDPVNAGTVLRGHCVVGIFKLPQYKLPALPMDTPRGDVKPVLLTRGSFAAEVLPSLLAGLELPDCLKQIQRTCTPGSTRAQEQHRRLRRLLWQRIHTSDNHIISQASNLQTAEATSTLAMQSWRPILMLRGCWCRGCLPVLLRQLGHLLLQELL